MRVLTVHYTHFCCNRAGHGTPDAGNDSTGHHRCLQVVCAGSQDTFEIFVWSVKTGRLLEVLHCTDARVIAGCHAQAA